MAVQDGQTEGNVIQKFFRNYGLAFIMVASYFGSGSIFIASEAGVRFGYGLIWAVVLSTVIGLVAQDMSARLGIFGEPLMGFTRRKLGQPAALLIALWLTLGCILWTLELTAAVGAGVSQLMGGAIGWQPLAVVTGVLAIVAGIRGYDSLEHLMTGMMFSLLIIYVVVATASGPDLGGVALGFLPIEGFSLTALTLIAGILGTTALWPNFFLESILVREKGWTRKEDVRTMRRDLIFGYSVGGIVTIAVLVVAATVLRPMGISRLDSFLTPGFALADV
ncbi:MAG TPA: divalent metal cation transporter, partial [Longimicrobiales bacterium]|nr:divalent metal cation transporter [Longimicrobiales bacterium]